MFSEQICLLRVSPKLFGVNGWIPQMIRQWFLDSWSGDRKCTGPKDAAANSRNWQLMTSGRSQVLATSNFRDWHTVVGEIPWSSVPKKTMDCHSKLVLHSLRNNQPVQVIVHQPRHTTLIFPGPSDLWFDLGFAHHWCLLSFQYIKLVKFETLPLKSSLVY